MWLVVSACNQSVDTDAMRERSVHRGARMGPLRWRRAIWTAIAAVSSIAQQLGIAVKDTRKQQNETRHAAVLVSFGSLVVQRDQWDTSWGPKKRFFLIREIDDAAMAGASVESCRFVVPRSLGGRSGSVQYMCNRLRRLRRRFYRCPIAARFSLRGRGPVYSLLSTARSRARQIAVSVRSPNSKGLGLGESRVRAGPKRS